MLSWKNKDFKHLDRKVLFKNLGTYLILGGVLFSMVFFGVCSPNFQNNMPTMLSGDAAKVAGESISQGDFRRAYTNTLERYRSQFRENFDPSMFQLSRVVLNQLIDERILYIEAKNLGLYAGEGDVVKVLQEAQIFKDESNKFSPERFQSFLRGNGYTEASLMHEIERSLMVQKLRELLLSMAYVSSEQMKLDKILTESKMNLSYLKFDPKNIKMVVSEQEVTEFLAKPENKEKVKKYFEDHKSEYEVAEKVKARHILIQFEGAFNAPEQAKKRKKDEALKS